MHIIVMNNTPINILKSTFLRLSQIGIGAPHEGYEVPLMIAGKKPCLITDWPLQAIKQGEDYTKLEPLIQLGQLVVIGIKEFGFPRHIICRPQDIESCSAEAILAEKNAIGQALTREEHYRHESFLEQYCGIKLRDSEGRFAPEEFNKRARRPEGDYQLLLDGIIQATLPIRTGQDFKLCPPQIMEQISKGALCTVHVTTETTQLAVIAQKDCAEMGRELFARYWDNDKGYEPLKDDDSARRVGHLLGYTPADTEFFLTVGTSPVSSHTKEDKLLIQSFDMLRYARAQALLQALLMDADAPTPS